MSKTVGLAGTAALTLTGALFAIAVPASAMSEPQDSTIQTENCTYTATGGRCIFFTPETPNGTGSHHKFIVPEGVSVLTVASTGSPYDDQYLPDRVVAEIRVTPGEEFTTQTLSNNYAHKWFGATTIWPTKGYIWRDGVDGVGGIEKALKMSQKDKCGGELNYCFIIHDVSTARGEVEVSWTSTTSE